MEEKNAIITKTTLTSDDHGLLSAWITLDYGDCFQGFGGFALYLPSAYKHSKNQKNYAGLFIWRVLEVAGITEWSRLVGRPVRVRTENNAIHSVGHIVKNDWFCPKEEFKSLENEAL